ncbi:hypothetical protein FB451DRAFT_1238229 [Mycena latifolia]|nr:hypothetical protein FB451DRAFT_1238229 [Mycena latifolia]
MLLSLVLVPSQFATSQPIIKINVHNAIHPPSMDDTPTTVIGYKDAEINKIGQGPCARKGRGRKKWLQLLFRHFRTPMGRPLSVMVCGRPVWGHHIAGLLVLFGVPERSPAI